MSASDVYVGLLWLLIVRATKGANLSLRCESDQVATGVRVLADGTAALLCETPACINWKIPAALFPDCTRTEYCGRNQYVTAISEKTNGRRKKKKKQRKDQRAERRAPKTKLLLNCCQSTVKFSRAVRTKFLLPGQRVSGGYTFVKGSSEFLLVSAIDKFLLRKKGYYVYRTILSRLHCDLPITIDEFVRR